VQRLSVAFGKHNASSQAICPILVKGLAVLVSMPEVLRLRAELAYFHRRLDAFEANVDQRKQNRFSLR
jgi:hypothetical protein